MTGATVNHSNLGGLGPDFAAPATLLYRSVGRTSDGRSIDLAVSALGNYTAPRPDKNGISGRFGIINLAGGSRSSMRFSFVDSESGAAVVMRHFYLSIFDLDQGTDGAARETLTAQGFSSYVRSSDSELDVLHSGADEIQISSTERGIQADNPTDPLDLTDVQGRRAVMLKFAETSQLQLTLTVGDSNWGRNFMFTGEHAFNLSTCPSPPPSPPP
eukprot:3993005-Prymnesium_polylepis.1